MNGIDPARLPWCRAAEDFIKFLFRELKPPASPSFLEQPFHFTQGSSDVTVISPSFADLFIVDASPECQRFLRVWSFILSSILGWEALVPPPEAVHSPVFHLSPLCLASHPFPDCKRLFSFGYFFNSLCDFLVCPRIFNFFSASLAKYLFKTPFNFFPSPRFILVICVFALCVVVVSSRAFFFQDVCLCFLSTKCASLMTVITFFHHNSILAKCCDFDEVLVCIDVVAHSFGRCPDILPIESDGFIIFWGFAIPYLFNFLLGDLIIDFVRLALS